MRVRMWAKEAPPNEVYLTAAVALVLAVGLIAVAIPSSAKDADPLLAAGAPLTAFPTDAGSPAPASANAATAPTADGGPAPIGHQSPELPKPGGGGTPGQTETTGASSAGGATSTAGGNPATATPPANQPLTASDQGVTEESVKIGFLNAQIAGFDATGFALGFRDDLREVQKALVDWANANGGVSGRKITHVVSEADPLSQSSMREGCIRMTDDEKVFVVFDQTATAGTALRCYAEKRTPNFNTNAGTVDSPFWNDAGGYLISGGATFDRGILSWASIEMANGVIGPDKGKLGILSDDCAPAPDVVDKVLKPFLDQHGIEYADERLSCDAGTAQQQVGAAALRLNAEGVGRVLLLPVFTSAQSFVQAAEGQRWTPPYSVMDKSGLVLDVTTQGFSPTAFDGARGTTYGRSGEDRRGVPFGAGVKQCDEIIRAAGLPGITNQMGTDGLAVASCDGFFTWLAAMKHTPTNPTRIDVIRGVAQIGAFPLAAFALNASYGPGKYQGADSFAVVRWSGDCRCWTQISDPHPARF